MCDTFLARGIVPIVTEDWRAATSILLDSTDKGFYSPNK